MISIFNFTSLLISICLLCFFYTLSIQSKKREQKKGEKAWKECMILRNVGAFFEFVIMINIILWIWFPISILNWLVSPVWLYSIIIGIIISIPCCIILILGMIAAGLESIKPSKETEMYGGIYKYIRHPQTLGEFPIFIAMGFFINSWFIIIIMISFNIIYTPIMIHYEEADLIRRFGNQYVEYQKRTGALFPKLRK